MSMGLNLLPVLIVLLYLPNVVEKLLISQPLMLNQLDLSFSKHARDCQKSGKRDTSAEKLRQTVSKILSKMISKKRQDNLSKTQRTALKQLKNDEQIKVYPFDKGIGFALLNDMDDISKIEKQFQKSKIIDYEPTNLLTGKFQRLLRKLKKEGKFVKRRTQ